MNPRACCYSAIARGLSSTVGTELSTLEPAAATTNNTLYQRTCDWQRPTGGSVNHEECFTGFRSSSTEFFSSQKINIYQVGIYIYIHI